MENTKEKLTLEMLCSYLPYGLKIYWKDSKEVYGIYFDEKIDFENKNYPFSTLLFTMETRTQMGWQPIFHTLSELEGTEQWNEIVSEHNYPDFGHFERSVLSGHAPHKLIMDLVKEHFWIYDQSYFEKAIILDINELNK